MSDQRATEAVVVSLMMLSATEAPTPTLVPPPAPAPMGSAFTVEAWASPISVKASFMRSAP